MYVKAPIAHLMRSGNWALVTRKVDIRRACRRVMRVFISGYMMGSPTSDSAQCLGCLNEQSNVSTMPVAPYA